MCLRVFVCGCLLLFGFVFVVYVCLDLCYMCRLLSCCCCCVCACCMRVELCVVVVVGC